MAQPIESSNSHISLEQSYIFRKLHPQEGMSYIWLVKWNLQAPPLTIPLPIKNLLTEQQKVNNLFTPVNPLSQDCIRSWLAYSKCQQYINEPKDYFTLKVIVTQLRINKLKVAGYQLSRGYAVTVNSLKGYWITLTNVEAYNTFGDTVDIIGMVICPWKQWYL